MKRLLAAVAVAGLIAVSGCTSSTPTPIPVPSVSESSVITEAPTVDPTTTDPAPEPTTVKSETQTPTVAPTTSEAGTPEVQFVKRWGLKYPGVEEYKIQKTANSVCKVISTDSEWTNNPAISTEIATLVDSAGMKASDGLEFAQDAEQSYCPSRVNPT